MRCHWTGLLLLAAPTWLWGRCGRHNSPPASSVMDLVFRRSDGSHVSVDTVHPSLLRSSSLSSPGWCHLQSFFLCSLGLTSTWSNHLSRAFLHLSAILSTFSLSLMFSFLIWSLSVWPHTRSAHLHFCRFQFLNVGASDWHCLHPVQHSAVAERSSIMYLSLHVCVGRTI